jgi:hypothetical protein
MISRLLSSSLRKSPKSVLLLGPRQVGKSTLIKALKPELDINLADEAQSWVLHANGSYERNLVKAQTSSFNCHRFFMENPSLSGRGSAGIKDAPLLARGEG